VLWTPVLPPPPHRALGHPKPRLPPPLPHLQLQRRHRQWPSAPPPRQAQAHVLLLLHACTSCAQVAWLGRLAAGRPPPPSPTHGRACPGNGRPPPSPDGARWQVPRLLIGELWRRDCNTAPWRLQASVQPVSSEHWLVHNHEFFFSTIDGISFIKFNAKMLSSVLDIIL
jgi:hypothetical protein